jgi:hypothetical protein
MRIFSLYRAGRCSAEFGIVTRLLPIIASGRLAFSVYGHGEGALPVTEAKTAQAFALNPKNLPVSGNAETPFVFH